MCNKNIFDCMFEGSKKTFPQSGTIACVMLNELALLTKTQTAQIFDITLMNIFNPECYITVCNLFYNTHAFGRFLTLFRYPTNG